MARGNLLVARRQRVRVPREERAHLQLREPDEGRRPFDLGASAAVPCRLLADDLAAEQFEFVAIEIGDERVPEIAVAPE